MLASKEAAIRSEISVENLDHLGIVAGLIDEIGIVERLNERLGIDPREKVSPSVVMKAMLLNGLGFVSAPLYLFEEFFKYTFAESRSEYGGVSQRWLLIESEQQRKSDLKQLSQKLEQSQQNAQQDLQRLSSQEFACPADAMSAAQTVSFRPRKNVTMTKPESPIKQMCLSA
jgi:transposase